MKTKFYTLINCTNSYLDEYTPLDENSRYTLTNFSGSTGDVLICPDGKILLFVDGRYHEQADLETDRQKITVVKMKSGQSQLNVICNKIRKNSVLKINPQKNSQARLEFLKNKLKEKNVSIEFWNEDNFSKCASRSDRKFIKITSDNFEQKIKKIKNNTLITNPEEISYLCDIRSFDKDYTTKVEGKFLILNGKYTLFTDYKPECKYDFKFNTKPENEFYKTISTIKDKIFIDKTSITAYDYLMLKKPFHKPSRIKSMKSVKAKSEIEHFKYAFSCTDKALFETRMYINNNDNLSEYDIEQFLRKAFFKYGAKSLSFKSIVAINENSAQAHYSKSSKDKILKEGDLVLIDCGAYYDDGLATDITRVFVKGKPSELQKEIYTYVLKAFLNCYNYKIKPETMGFDIDKLARKVFRNCETKDFTFSHGLGHGIGISVHENPPNLSKNNIAKTVLKNNMCFTIEPGLYNPECFGVRLENSCYLNKGKITSFTNMCFEKALINYDLLSEKEKTWLKEFEVL